MHGETRFRLGRYAQRTTDMAQGKRYVYTVDCGALQGPNVGGPAENLL